MVNVIKEALDLNNVKENKLYLIIRIMVSILLGVSYFLDSILVFKNDGLKTYWMYSGYEDVYFISPSPNSFLLLFLVSFFSFILISLVGLLVEKIKKKIWKHKEKNKYNKITTYILIFTAIYLMYLPYALSFYPGGYDCNSRSVINQAIGKEIITNHYPVFYTFITSVFINTGRLIDGTFETGYTFLSTAQFIFMIGMISYFIYWWYKKGANKKVIIAMTLFFGLFKLFPLYAVTIWKETPFSLFIILYTLQIADIVLSKGNKLKSNKFIASYVINTILISCLRNNGIYIVIATTIFIIFTYRKYKKFIVTFCITSITLVIIQGPVFNILKINSKYIEKIGVPLQQISYVIVYNGNITEEQHKYLETIMSIDLVKRKYTPWNVDYIKFDSEVNEELIKNNKFAFFKTWIELFIQNPQMYIKAYLLNITGFWNINRVYNGDIKDYANPITNKVDQIESLGSQRDLLLETTGFSLKKYMFSFTNEKEISTAIFIFIILISLAYTIKSKQYKLILIYLPVLCTLGSILIATPIAFGLRYVYPVVLFTPFAILIPMMSIDKDNYMKKQ